MAGSPASAPSLTPGRAALLGTIQGPAELLPISSSAHLSLVPWFAGWDLETVDSEARKAFEVALHAGTAVALVVALRREIAGELRAFGPNRAAVIALSALPPAIAGLTFERAIERRLGSPLATAAGLAVGALAMMIADHQVQARHSGDARPADGLALGLAQMAALAPGVSRNGATLTAARARRFDRAQANLLSRTVALPVIVGASLLKGARLASRGVDRDLGRALAIGGGAAFASTLASQLLIGLAERDRALWPYGVYRTGLAAAVAVTSARRRGHDRRS